MVVWGRDKIPLDIHNTSVGHLGGAESEQVQRIKCPAEESLDTLIGIRGKH